MSVEITTGRKPVHGMSHTITYSSWRCMIRRCTNKNAHEYPKYGGNNIQICERWKSFINFLEDLGERPNLKFSLDRVDNNQGYYPGNCRWATIHQQSRNKSSNVYISHKGETKLLCTWAAEYGISQKLLRMRYCVYGWPMERALQPKDFKTSIRITYSGMTKTIPQWADHFQMSKVLLRQRLQKGWEFEKAIRKTKYQHRNTLNQ